MKVMKVREGLLIRGQGGGLPKKGLKRAGERSLRPDAKRERRLQEEIQELKEANERLALQVASYRQAESIARAQHYFRKAVEESISLGIIAFGINGRQIYVNPTFCRMVGWSQEALIGAMPPFLYWPSEKIKIYTRYFQSVIEQKQNSQSLEVLFQRKNGERFNALLMYAPLKDGEGRLIGWVSSVGNITERKQTEQALRKSEAAARRWAQELATMSAIGRIISSTLNIEEIYDRFAEEARKLIPFDRVNINLINFKAKNVISAFSSGITESGRKIGETFPLAGSATEHVLKTRAGFLLFPTDEEELKDRFPGLVPTFHVGHRSMITVPLISKDKVIGSLYFGSIRPHVFGDQELRLAAEVGAQIAGAIAGAQVFSELVLAREALKESEKRVKRLSHQLLLAEEKERKRISHEIHDGLGQLLNAIKFKVEDIHQKSERVDEINQYKDTIRLIQQSIDEARRIQMNLRPSILDDLGILPTMDWLCRVFNSTCPSVQINKRIELEEQEVPDPLKIVIYRISQEALNNVAKYSGAELVNLCLGKAEGAIELTIQDHGRGFNLQEALATSASSAHGLGLSSMRERAELVGGSFLVESEVGKGTTVRVCWPVEPRPL